MTKKVCKDCETVAEPVSVTPGSIIIELVLWLCLIFPGVIYSLWRHSKRHDVCPACGSASIVPTSSPLGKKLVGDVEKQPGSAEHRRDISGSIGIGRAIGKAASRIFK